MLATGEAKNEVDAKNGVSTPTVLMTNFIIFSLIDTFFD
jgi:hypothetical protein